MVIFGLDFTGPHILFVTNSDFSDSEHNGTKLLHKNPSFEFFLILIMEHGSLSTQNIDELLSSLPACRRCRLNKRRCDIALPSCHNCSKAGAECVFFDHALQEDIPRA